MAEQETLTNNPEADSIPEQPAGETGTALLGPEAGAEEGIEGQPQGAMPAEQPVWWHNLRATHPGITDEAKALQYINEVQAYATRQSQRAADLERQLKTTGQKSLTWQERLKKHTRYDENGTAYTDYDAALAERDAEREAQLFSRIENLSQHKESVKKTFGEIEEMAKNKLIPEWSVPGNGTPGSEFYLEVDSLFTRMANAIPEVMNHPEAAKIAVYAALGMRAVGEKDNAIKRKLGTVAKLAGSGNRVPSILEKTAAEMSDEEVRGFMKRLKGE